MEKPRYRTLTIRLLRKGRAIHEAFTKAFAPGGERALSQLSWHLAKGATLFVGQIYSGPPNWKTFLTSGANGLSDANISSGGAGAILFLPVESRSACVCFGQVHIALDDDAFERQFGLKVTLNSVPRDGIRTLDLATPDAVTFQRRIQASQDSDLREFGVDRLRDLARVAGGTPEEKDTFARFVAGKDSLSITCRAAPETLLGVCEKVLKTYRKKTYKKEFGWIDNIRLVAALTIDHISAAPELSTRARGAVGRASRGQPRANRGRHCSSSDRRVRRRPASRRGRWVSWVAVSWRRRGEPRVVSPSGRSWPVPSYVLGPGAVATEGATRLARGWRVR